MAVGSYDPPNVKTEEFVFETGSWKTGLPDYPYAVYGQFMEPSFARYEMLFVRKMAAYIVIGGVSYGDTYMSQSIAMFRYDKWSEVGQLNKKRAVNFKHFLFRNYLLRDILPNGQMTVSSLLVDTKHGRAKNAHLMHRMTFSRALIYRQH